MGPRGHRTTRSPEPIARERRVVFRPGTSTNADGDHRRTRHERADTDRDVRCDVDDGHPGERRTAGHLHCGPPSPPARCGHRLETEIVVSTDQLRCRGEPGNTRPHTMSTAGRRSGSADRRAPTPPDTARHTARSRTAPTTRLCRGSRARPRDQGDRRRAPVAPRRPAVPLRRAHLGRRRRARAARSPRSAHAPSLRSPPRQGVRRRAARPSSPRPGEKEAARALLDRRRQSGGAAQAADGVGHASARRRVHRRAFDDRRDRLVGTGRRLRQVPGAGLVDATIERRPHRGQRAVGPSPLAIRGRLDDGGAHERMRNARRRSIQHDKPCVFCDPELVACETESRTSALDDRTATRPVERDDQQRGHDRRVESFHPSEERPRHRATQRNRVVDPVEPSALTIGSHRCRDLTASSQAALGLSW